MIFLSTIHDEMSQPESTRYRLYGCRSDGDGGGAGIFQSADAYSGGVYNSAGVYQGAGNTAYVDNYDRDANGGDVRRDGQNAYDNDVFCHGIGSHSSTGYAEGPTCGVWIRCLVFVWGCCGADLFYRPPMPHRKSETYMLPSRY